MHMHMHMHMSHVTCTCHMHMHTPQLGTARRPLARLRPMHMHMHISQVHAHATCHMHMHTPQLGTARRPLARLRPMHMHMHMSQVHAHVTCTCTHASARYRPSTPRSAATARAGPPPPRPVLAGDVLDFGSGHHPGRGPDHPRTPRPAWHQGPHQQPPARLPRARRGAICHELARAPASEMTAR